MSRQNGDPKEVRVLTRLTPRAADILFYERVEAGKYRGGVTLPENGTAHPQASSWPNHTLCAILDDGEEGWLRFYYAAERASQHLYNWEMDRSEGALLPRCKQTWVLPRSEVLSEGSAKASLTLSAAQLTAVYQDWSSLAVTVGDPVNGNVTVGIELDNAADGLNNPAALALEDDHFDAATVAALLAGAGLDAVAADGEVTIRSQETGEASSVRVWVTEYNGVGFVLVSDVTNFGTGPGVFAPEDLTAPPLPGTWTQTGVEYKRIGDERLDGLFVVVEAGWEILSDTLVGYEMDELTGEVLPFTRQKMTKAAANAAAQSPDETGIYKEVEPINSRYSWVVTRKATSLAGATQSWDELQEVPGHIFPMVLTGVSANPVYRYVESGSEETFVERFYFIITKKEAWRGPVKVTVSRTWSHEPFEITLPAQPRPEAMVWDALIDTLSLPPCLHAELALTVTIGSDDPFRPSQNANRTFGATADFTDWPETLVFANGQRQHRGGYLKTTLTAHKPY